MIERAELVDFLVADGESLALQGETVYRLGAIATVIMEAAERPVSVDTLVGLLEDRFGAPPEGTLEDAVEAQLVALREAGLLRPELGTESGS